MIISSSSLRRLLMIVFWTRTLFAFSPISTNFGRTIGNTKSSLQYISKSTLTRNTSPTNTYIRLSKTSASALESTTSQKTIAEGIYSDEQIIKKSRFIGIIQHCESWKDAQDFIAAVRAEHPKSRHVCFGFVAGVNPVTERSSDDGEPTGTGGAPILGSLRGNDLSDAVCAVVRYSGGIKLGAGGLIRAYGGTASLAIQAAETKILIPKSTFRLLAPGAYIGAVYETINKFGGSIGGESYNELGDLEATVVCETKIFEDVQMTLQDATRGEIMFMDDSDDDSN